MASKTTAARPSDLEPRIRELVTEAWEIVCDGSPGDDGDGAIDLFDMDDRADLSTEAIESLCYLRGVADALDLTIRELIWEAAP